MDKSEFQGVFGIIPTPIKENEDVDEEGLSALIRHCADNGLHAAVVLGSNGDFPYFTCEEKNRIIRVAAEAAAGDIPVIAGASALSTREAISYAKAAKEAGCQAVMAALPVYWRLGVEEAKDHYRMLAEEGGLPVLFYYFPEVTSLVLSPEEIAEIAEIDGVHGAKITVMNRSFLKQTIKLTRTSLWSVFAGTSFLMRYTLKEGGAGVVCPLPIIAPKDCMDLYKAMADGDMDKASDLQDKLLRAIPIFSGADIPHSVGGPYWKASTAKPYIGPPERPASTVALVKEALRLQGHPVNAKVRKPISPITPEQSDLVKRALKDGGWL